MRLLWPFHGLYAYYLSKNDSILHLYTTFIWSPNCDLLTSTDQSWSVDSVEIEKSILPLLLRVLQPFSYGMFACLSTNVWVIEIGICKSEELKND